MKRITNVTKETVVHYIVDWFCILKLRVRYLPHKLEGLPTDQLYVSFFFKKIFFYMQDNRNAIFVYLVF